LLARVLRTSGRGRHRHHQSWPEGDTESGSDESDGDTDANVVAEY
jgi:hypothetical protein